jgi:aspartokinase
MSPARDPALTLDEVVARLAPTIGSEKSREVVASAVRTLGSFDADAVLKVLEEQAGIVGLAARFARTRMPKRAASSMPHPVVHSGSQGPDPNPTQPGSEQGQKRTIRCQAIIDLLASTLGEEASVELVHAALRRLGIEGEELDSRDAMRLLEAIAAVPGLVGITARFAKARVILLF